MMITDQGIFNDMKIKCIMLMAPLMVAVSAVSQTPTATAFVNVSVVPMDRERLLSGQTVLVRDGRIVVIGPSSKVHVPAGAIRIDGRGRFLMPGMADMHVHLGFPSASADDPTLEKTLFMFVANGITTVRDMHGGRIPDAPQRALWLKKLVAAGKLVGPHIYTAGDPDISSPEAAAKTTAALKADGYDFVKMYGFTGTIFDSIVSVAHRVGLPIVGHPPSVPENAWVRMLNTPYYSVEHLMGTKLELLGLSGRWQDGGLLTQGKEFLTSLVDTAVWMQPGYQVDQARLREIALTIKRAGIWNCPTLIVGDMFLREGVAGFGTDSLANKKVKKLSWRVARRRFEIDLQIVKALHTAGALLLAGADQIPLLDDADVPPGFALQRELALMVQAGLTPYQVLETTTRNAALFLHTQDSTGTIAVGKRADLVLLGENPLKDIGAVASLAGVMLGGQWFTRGDIDRRLDAWGTFGPHTKSPTHDLTNVRRMLWRTPAPQPHP
jgi:hypothetical protein